MIDNAAKDGRSPTRRPLNEPTPATRHSQTGHRRSNQELTPFRTEIQSKSDPVCPSLTPHSNPMSWSCLAKPLGSTSTTVAGKLHHRRDRSEDRQGLEAGLFISVDHRNESFCLHVVYTIKKPSPSNFVTNRAFFLQHSHLNEPPSFQIHKMGINRVVQFQFKPDVTNDAIDKVQSTILSLYNFP